jgi:cell division ATPase FtsA
MFKLEKVYCNVYINNDLMKIVIVSYSKNDTDILYTNSIDHKKSIVDGFISNNEIFNQSLFSLFSSAYKYIPLVVRRIILVLPSNIFVESINQNDKILYTSGSVTLKDIHNSISLSTNPEIKNHHCVSSGAYQFELDGQMYTDPPINKPGNQLRALIVSYYLANNLFSKLEQSFNAFDIEFLEVIPEAVCASYNVASTELLDEGITHLIIEKDSTIIVPTIKGMQYKPYTMKLGTNNILNILSEKMNLSKDEIINYSKLLDFQKDNQKETILRRFEDYYESIKNTTLEDFKTKIKSNLDIFFEKIIDKMNELRLYSNNRKKVFI